MKFLTITILVLCAFLAVEARRRRQEEDPYMKARYANADKDYDTAIKYLEIVIAEKKTFENSERFMIQSVFRNAVDKRRQEMKALNAKLANNAFENRYEEYDTPTSDKLYEILDITTKAINLLDTYLIPNAQSAEEKVFYAIMKADHMRYQVEYHLQTQYNTVSAETALAAYDAAEQLMLSNGLTKQHYFALQIARSKAIIEAEFLHHYCVGVHYLEEALKPVEGVTDTDDGFFDFMMREAITNVNAKLDEYKPKCVEPEEVEAETEISVGNLA